MFTVPPMSLGSQIKRYRSAAQLTLLDLAELSDVDVGTINALEVRNSKRSMHAPALARGLGLSIEQLLDESMDWTSAVQTAVARSREGAGSANAPTPIRRDLVEDSPRGVPLPPITWPFLHVTYRRVMDLPKAARDDIDELLEVAVSKWEKRIERKKKYASR